MIRLAPFHSTEDFLTCVDLRPQEAASLARVGAIEGLGIIPSILETLQSGGWQQNQLSLLNVRQFSRVFHELPVLEDQRLTTRLPVCKSLLSIW